MILPFSKMHGLGNDFILLDNVQQHFQLTVPQIRFIADRHLGIGCDQLLLVEAASDPSCDFFYRIFNADGSEAEQCGNGARCFARFVHRQGLSDKVHLRLQTQAGILETERQAKSEVTVNMGVPCFDPASIPLVRPLADHYQSKIAGQAIDFGAVSMGNPHAVIAVAQIATAAVETIGPSLSSDADFPRKTNVGFMQVVSATHIRLRVFERGAGETQACGSGACAAVAVGRIWQRLAEKVQVDLPGGQLMVSWAGPGQPLWLRGPTQHVFQGSIEL